MKFFILFALALTACSTGIIPTDGGTYMIARRSAQVGAGPPVGAQAKAYKDANDFCAKQGRSVETVKIDLDPSSFGHPGSVNLQFRCVSPPK